MAAAAGASAGHVLRHVGEEDHAPGQRRDGPGQGILCRREQRAVILVGGKRGARQGAEPRERRSLRHASPAAPRRRLAPAPARPRRTPPAQPRRRPAPRAVGARHARLAAARVVAAGRRAWRGRKTPGARPPRPPRGAGRQMVRASPSPPLRLDAPVRGAGFTLPSRSAAANPGRRHAVLPCMPGDARRPGDTPTVTASAPLRRHAILAMLAVARGLRRAGPAGCRGDPRVAAGCDARRPRAGPRRRCRRACLGPCAGQPGRARPSFTPCHPGCRQGPSCSPPMIVTSLGAERPRQGGAIAYRALVVVSNARRFGDFTARRDAPGRARRGAGHRPREAMRGRRRLPVRRDVDPDLRHPHAARRGGDGNAHPAARGSAAARPSSR